MKTFLLAFACVAQAALAHGPVIPLVQTRPGVIGTYQLDLDGNDADGYTPTLAARSFQIVPLAYQGDTAYPNDNGWYGQLEPSQPSNGEDTSFLGPGLAYGQGGFTSTTVFRITFTDIARVWTPDSSAAGGSFTSTGGETIRGVRGNFATVGFANTLRSDGVSTGTALQSGVVGVNAGAHGQYRWRLEGPAGSPVPSAANGIDDGLYLASLSVAAYASAAATTPYAASSIYYLLFEKNFNGGVTAADELNAQAYLATIAPEPTGMAGLVLVVLGLRRRRL